MGVLYRPRRICVLEFAILIGTFSVLLTDGQTDVTLLKPNSPLTLTCPPVTSSLPGDVTWSRNSTGPLTNGSKYVVNSANRSLTINVVILDSDLGPYICTVQSNSAIVTVKSAPIMAKPPKAVNLVEGNDLSLNCLGFAYPPPSKVTWTKDGGQPMTSSTDNRVSGGLIVNNLWGNGSFGIGGVVMGDQGLYTCVIENSVGVGNVTVNVRVNSKYAALWPFIGVLLQVIAIIVIIIAVERKRAKSKIDNKEN